MGQVTIYLEDEIEKQMSLAAKSSNLSKSKWISALIKSKVDNEWPSAIHNLAGTWKNFSKTKEIPSRESL